MDKKHDEAIFKRFDFFNPKGNIQETLIPFGLACSNGWYNIIYELCEKIEEEIENDPNLKDFEVLQVKEKFAQLHFYINFGNEKIFKFIEEAESKSLETCEVCGEPGFACNNGGWCKTLCQKCADKTGYHKG